MRFSDQDKLAAIEEMIASLRWAKNDEALPEHRLLMILKEIDRDVRARDPATTSRTLQTLAFHVDAATRAKARVGYLDAGHAQAVAEALMAHWSTVRRALERPEKERAA